MLETNEFIGPIIQKLQAQVDWRLLTEVSIAWLTLFFTGLGMYVTYIKWRSSVIIVSADDWLKQQKRNDELNARNDELNEKWDREREQRRQVEDELEQVREEMRKNSRHCEEKLAEMDARIQELEKGNKT